VVQAAALRRVAHHSQENTAKNGQSERSVGKQSQPQSGCPFVRRTKVAWRHREALATLKTRIVKARSMQISKEPDR